ncbi:hypothetical protein [Aquimarina litoralis]|uniref:hypothetical protein n=1 Tax=Aquimarina litoralis TaxID=584605 RepID=UPI001C598154|nr:hypothetical protein [Aquimarina litoralis]MBW1298506.1 hypothetical protein [Aquimarina litoralis]
MKKLLVLMLTMVSVITNAQELPDVTPISPEAASIGKYGQIPVGLFTGTPQVSIPIHEFKSGPLSVPISLNYSSNGIRIDEYASSVGLGWNLSAGGVITRSVRGQRDENQYVPAKDVNLDFSVDQYNFVTAATMPGNNAIDTQPDIFSFNFNGFSGKFYLDDNSTSFLNREVVFIEPSPLKVELIQVHPETHFRITDPNGIKYYFGGENAIEKFRYEATNQADNPENSAAVASAWYLTKITHPSGEEISFSYQVGGGRYINSISQSVRREDRLVNYQGLAGYCAPSASDTAYLNIALGNFCYLTEIRSTHSGSVLFSYSQKASMPTNFLKLDAIDIKNVHNQKISSFDLDYSVYDATGPKNWDIVDEEYYSKRYFLSSVTQKSENGTALNPYVLSYDHPEDLPSRFSYAQDYWGFYNGKSSNSNLIDQKSIDRVSSNFVLYNGLNDFDAADRTPSASFAQKGILSQITYPTKGSNTFLYEGHGYYGTVTVDPPTTSKTAEVTNPAVMNNSFEIYDIKYAHEGTLSFTANIDDFVGDINGGGDNPLDFDIAQIRIYDITGSTPVLQPIYFTSDINFTNPVTTPYGITNTNFSKSMVIRLEKDHDYRFEISLDPHYSLSHIQLSYKDAFPTEVQQNIPVGGVRLAQVNTLNGEGKTEVKKFHYGSLDCLDCESGTVFNRNIEPQITNSETFFCFYNPVGKCIPAGVCGNTILSSNTAFPLYGSQGYHIGYRYVVEEFGENFLGGAKEHIFDTNYSIEPNVAVLGEYISGTPLSNFFGFGRKLGERVFKKEGNQFTIVQEVINNYYHDTSLDKNTNVYAVRKHTNIIQGYIYITDENFTFENRLFDITQYNIKRQWHVLQKQITKQYDQEGNNPLVTSQTYFYDNAQHLQQTRVHVEDSKGRIVDTKTIFPQDIALSSRTTEQQQLIDLHQISTPIEVITAEVEGTANRKVSRVHTDFENWGTNLLLPKVVESAKNTSALEPRIVYTSYDSYGNPQEVSRADGMPITYIWGYDHQYPVAKIENATYEDVESYVANIQSKSNDDVDRTIGNLGTEGDLRQALNALRNILPDDVMVSTYTYDPMIGITSMTDARGYTVYYQYDEHQRLQYVRDEEGHLISENAYNYKN